MVKFRGHTQWHSKSTRIPHLPSACFSFVRIVTVRIHIDYTLYIEDLIYVYFFVWATLKRITDCYISYLLKTQNIAIMDATN